jgi:hypothetical protein
MATSLHLEIYEVEFTKKKNLGGLLIRFIVTKNIPNKTKELLLQV